ncbi:MAG: protein translocase subunit SecF [Candidatus Poribacteria bacterium]|nr:protein translocase subunit SecF [Candidatus Poribacteria bacterium]
MQLLQDTNIDFISQRKIGYFLSAIIILTGIFSLFWRQGPDFGIDFSGGVKIRAELPTNSSIQEKNIKSQLEELGYSTPNILVEGGSVTIAVSGKQDVGSGQKIAQMLQRKFTISAADIEINEVGPSVGQDLKWTALLSVLWSIIILLIYISFRFHLRFALGAIVAIVHDVLVTLGIFSLLAKEINLPTVAAFLTIIGYSLNDTIVVFDRIRENQDVLKKSTFIEILNRSINQSLSRTVITSLTTLAVVITIFVLSSTGEEINTFALALIVGVLVGTYSSIFIATPIVYLLHERRAMST